jgi:hypothetical protein
VLCDVPGRLMETHHVCRTGPFGYTSAAGATSLWECVPASQACKLLLLVLEALVRGFSLRFFGCSLVPCLTAVFIHPYLQAPSVRLLRPELCPRSSAAACQVCF